MCREVGVDIDLLCPPSTSPPCPLLNRRLVIYLRQGSNPRTVTCRTQHWHPDGTNLIVSLPSPACGHYFFDAFRKSATQRLHYTPHNIGCPTVWSHRAHRTTRLLAFIFIFVFANRRYCSCAAERSWKRLGVPLLSPRPRLRFDRLVQGTCEQRRKPRIHAAYPTSLGAKDGPATAPRSCITATKYDAHRERTHKSVIRVARAASQNLTPRGPRPAHLPHLPHPSLFRDAWRPSETVRMPH